MLFPAEMMKLYAIFPRDYLDRVMFKLQEVGTVEFFDVKEDIRNMFDTDNLRSSLEKLKIDGEISLCPLESRQDLIVSEKERVKSLLSEFKPVSKTSFLSDLLGPPVVPISIVKKPGDNLLEKIKAEIDEIEDAYRTLQKKRTELDRKKEDITIVIAREAKLRLLKLMGTVKDAEIAHLEKLKREEVEVSARLQKLDRKISQFKKENYHKLLALNEELENLLRRAKAISNLVSTPHAVILGGWVPKSDVGKTIRALEKATNNMLVVEVQEALPEENPPIKLQNPKLFEPFEILIESYGLPKYREIDPTPLIGLTFTILFGIMFADVGYGLFLLLLSIVLLLEIRSSSKFLRSLNLVLMYAAMSSIVFGFILGEFFGGLIRVEPMWKEPLGNLGLLFLLSMILGVIHISISLFSRLYEELIQGKKGVYPISLVIILFSSLFILIFPEHSRVLFLLFSGGIVALSWIRKFKVIEELMALFANIISYARIAALLVLHVMVARILTALITSLPFSFSSFILGVLIFFAGTLLILVSGTFLVFVHSLRLQWLEFFKRFYSGGGKKFEPLSFERKYIFMTQL